MMMCIKIDSTEQKMQMRTIQVPLFLLTPTPYTLHFTHIIYRTSESVTHNNINMGIYSSWKFRFCVVQHLAADCYNLFTFEREMYNMFNTSV